MTAARRDLPVGFRGYDRAATDAVLTKLEERQAAVARERDELASKIEDLQRELEEHRNRAQAVADALVTAQRVALDLRAVAESEIEEQRREVDDQRGRISEEGASIRAEARQEATEIVREARIRADRLIDEVVAALVDHQHDTDDFVTTARDRLVGLVQDVLGRMPGSAPDHTVPSDEPEHVEVEADDDAPAADVAAA